MDPSKRLHPRYQCKLQAKVITLPSKRNVEGVLVDIGLGGALIQTHDSLETEVRMAFALEQVNYVLDAYVVRQLPPDPSLPKTNIYGLEFHPNPQIQDRLKILLERLKSGPREN